MQQKKKEKLLDEDVVKYLPNELSLKNNRSNDVYIIIEKHVPLPQLEEIKLILLLSRTIYAKKD